MCYVLTFIVTCGILCLWRKSDINMESDMVLKIICAYLLLHSGVVLIINAKRGFPIGIFGIGIPCACIVTLMYLYGLFG